MPVSSCTRAGALALGDWEILGCVLGISNSGGGWEVEVCFQMFSVKAGKRFDQCKFEVGTGRDEIQCRGNIVQSVNC